MFASISSAPGAVIELLNSKIAYIPKQKKHKCKPSLPSYSSTLSSKSSSGVVFNNDPSTVSAAVSIPILFDTDEVPYDANEPLIDLLNDFPKRK